MGGGGTDENTDGNIYHFSGRRPLSTQGPDPLQGTPEKRWCLTGQVRVCEVDKRNCILNRGNSMRKGTMV